MTLIYYHGIDLDGFCSAAICKKYNTNSVCIPVSYGIPADLSLIQENSKVFLVDYMFSDLSILENILSKTNNLIWIDHHASVIKTVKELGFKIPGIQRAGVGACQLCYFPPKG